MPPAPLTIDLNADLGEGFGAWALTDDAGLLDVVTSANVACGYHAGDASTMRAVCRAAAAAGVQVGAQVAYPDLQGFGRRVMDIAPGELADQVLHQLAGLDGIARAEGTRVAYLKPHGALYNRIVTDAEQGAAVVAGVTAFDPSLPVLGLPNAVWLPLAAAAGHPVWHEAFADRAYEPDGTLVPRWEADAVLHDPAVIADRAVRMIVEREVVARDGTVIAIRPNSLCVHGDTPGAVAVAQAVRAALTAAGVTITPVRSPA